MQRYTKIIAIQWLQYDYQPILYISLTCDETTLSTAHSEPMNSVDIVQNTTICGDESMGNGAERKVWLERRFLPSPFYVLTLHPLMKRKCFILCALSITLSCHAQFYSITRDEKRPDSVTVINPITEQTDTLQTKATQVVDFEQWMLNLWTSVSMPLDKMLVTSRYGMRHHPIYRKNMPHNGIDFGVPTGTKVYAIMDGIVQRIGYDSRSGNFVVIDHGDYTVSYCHLSKILVAKGERVKAGQTTCLAGSTGASTGSHLHLGLRDRQGKWCNPKILLDLVERTRKTVLAMIQQHGGLAS